MSARPKPTCTNAIAWLRANGHNLGALTGQDRRALDAIAHCWELYAIGDDDGRAAAIAAVRALAGGMQKKCLPFARELIAHVLDWDDRERLWPMALIVDGRGPAWTPPPVVPLFGIKTVTTVRTSFDAPGFVKEPSTEEMEAGVAVARALGVSEEEIKKNGGAL